MIRVFNRSDLRGSYVWPDATNDTKVRDDETFDPSLGPHVLRVLNRARGDSGRTVWFSADEIEKAERLLRAMPGHVTTIDDVVAFFKDSWRQFERPPLGDRAKALMSKLRSKVR